MRFFFLLDMEIWRVGGCISTVTVVEGNCGREDIYSNE
jgi:hypothetical protein